MKSVEKRTPLAEAFEFTQDDLVANRQGRLTACQRSKLVIKKDTSIRFIILIDLLLIVVAVVGIWYFGKHGENFLIWFCVIGLMALPFMGYAAVRGEQDRWQADIGEGNVESICGVIWLDVRHRRAWLVDYLLMIGQREWFISKEQFLMLHHGASYCIYYVPKHKMILSIEAIKDQTGD